MNQEGQRERLRRFSGLFIVLIVTLPFSGCLRPYSKSVIDPPTADFPGISSYWHGNSASDVRVLFVHGMCTHTEDSWINQGWDDYIPAFFSSPPPDKKTLPPVGQINIFDREYHVGSNTISARFILWSKLTTADKARLQFDGPPPAPGEFIWKRASLNADLKTNLMNDCLSDAVIYAGYRAQELRTAMQNALCAALDGTVSNGNCDFPVTYAHGNRRIVIVTESLGSRMVFDAISGLKLDAERKGTEALAAYDEAAAPISQIFMLANQLPIFSLAQPALGEAAPTVAASASPTPSMSVALSVLSEAKGRHRQRQSANNQALTFQGSIHIVAFTDPNDLLSYRIPPGDTAILGNGATVVNVLTSNSGALFDYVENPYPAHTAYSQNKDVLRLLFGGSQRRVGH